MGRTATPVATGGPAALLPRIPPVRAAGALAIVAVLGRGTDNLVLPVAAAAVLSLAA